MNVQAADHATRVASRLAKPVYWHRPDQVFKRLRAPGSGRTVVRLPCGLPLEVDVGEMIGSGIARTGVHELGVTETLWRLTAPGDLAVDVGANVGYMTAIMAARAAETIAFEPHPDLRELLARNVGRWGVQVTIDGRAASDEAGTATLTMPEDFADNHGTASLGDGPGYTVTTVPLDAVIDRPVGVLKVDVEGHEMAVLRGARRTLAAGLVRDVFFEDYGSPPTPIMRLLSGYGFEAFGLREEMRGVRLVAPGEGRERWAAPTYLATRAPERALSLMRRRGWWSLRPRARGFDARCSRAAGASAT